MKHCRNGKHKINLMIVLYNKNRNSAPRKSTPVGTIFRDVKSKICSQSSVSFPKKYDNKIIHRKKGSCYLQNKSRVSIRHNFSLLLNKKQLKLSIIQDRITNFKPLVFADYTLQTNNSSTYIGTRRTATRTVALAFDWKNGPFASVIFT